MEKSELIQFMPRFGRIEIRIEGAAQISECLELEGLFVREEKEGGGEEGRREKREDEGEREGEGEEVVFRRRNSSVDREKAW